jgi:hypothetical protein
MGFEVHIIGFEGGGPAWLPIQRIRDAFGAHVADSDSPVYAWRLCYPDEPHQNGVSLMQHPTDASLLQGFIVDSPGADPRMWDALASILASGPFALVFTDNHPPLIGNSGVLQHLPPDMIESMGQPKLVRSGQDILDEIRNS